MKNRYTTSKIVSSVQSRLSQVSHERERGLVQAEAGVQLPIIQPEPEREIDYSRSLFYLKKRYTPGPVDRLFDKIAVYRCYDNFGNFQPVIGQNVIIYSYNVPVGQKLIVSQYLYFILIDERPAINHPVLASPMELHRLTNTTAFGRFQLLCNGIPNNDFTYSTAFGPANVFNDIVGSTILSENPNGESDPNHGGLTIPFAGGSVLSVVFINQQYAYGLPSTRRFIGLGCRLRGFLSPVNPEEK